MKAVTLSHRLSFLSLGIFLVTPTFAALTIDYVLVGNAGNAADSRTGLGAVAYDYYIGKYEVTNAQYTEFLNNADPTGTNPNGIYNSSMGSDARGGITYTPGAANGAKYTTRSNMDNKPVNNVSWFDAARFVNWMGNGQGAGSTETGAYTLSGTSGAPLRNVGVTFSLPSVNEWYKAAYYDPTPGAGTNNYWLYPTQSDTRPTVATANATGDISNPGANVANYNQGADWNGQNGNVTTVGSAGARNFYGTFDQAGNVNEWNESINSGVLNRGLSGGSLFFFDNGMRVSLVNHALATGETFDNGFRIIGVPIPEPSALVLSMLAGGGDARPPEALVIKSLAYHPTRLIILPTGRL